jgi:parallel beta-helix repeat protein
MRFLLVILSVTLLAKSVVAFEAAGHIDQNTTWSGDVKVLQDVIVSPGVTLCIQHARVQMATNTAIQVHGQIIAEESTFSSATTRPAIGYWAGIVIEPNEFAFTPSRQAASSINHCSITQTNTAIRIVGRQLLNAPTVSDCQVRDCQWGGIVIDGCDGARIEKNVIENVAMNRLSDQGRPVALLHCTNAQIVGNKISNSSDTGIFLYGCQNIEVRDNRTRHLVGGPGPGLGGSYKAWGFGTLLQESSHCHVTANHFIDSAYIAVCLAYGSNDNLIDSNECSQCLDAINVVGGCANNVMRDNRVGGGWSILYVTGTGPVTYEKCDIPDSGGNGGGYCFTVRTGKANFVSCDWHARTMNIWGGNVIVDRCGLHTPTGIPSVSLMKDAVGKLIDCDFDAASMTADPKASGHIDVQHRLSLTVLDAKSGRPIAGCHVTAQPTNPAEAPVESTTDAQGNARLALTQFVFSAKGKTAAIPWAIRVARENYTAKEFSLTPDATRQETVLLSP